MKSVTALVFGLSVLFAAVNPAVAADCTVTGWTFGEGARPIFKCPDDAQR